MESEREREGGGETAGTTRTPLKKRYPCQPKHAQSIRRCHCEANHDQSTKNNEIMSDVRRVHTWNTVGGWCTSMYGILWDGGTECRNAVEGRDVADEANDEDAAEEEVPLRTKKTISRPGGIPANQNMIIQPRTMPDADTPYAYSRGRLSDAQLEHASVNAAVYASPATR